MKTFNAVSRLFCVLSLICFLSASSIAQKKEEHKGKYALQFQISQNFTLSSFQGSVISGKYNFSENDAIRLGVGINTNNQENNELNTYSNQAPNYSRVNTNIFNNYSVGIQYIRNNYYSNGINFYFGGGPNIGYYYNGNTYKDINGGSRSIETQWSYGIGALAGVEWYFLDRMSLSAEYGILFNHYEDTKSNTQIVAQSGSGIESKINGFNVNGNSVRFGLSVYF